MGWLDRMLLDEPQTVENVGSASIFTIETQLMYLMRHYHQAK
jgi:hypothetical protein